MKKKENEWIEHTEFRHEGRKTAKEQCSEYLYNMQKNQKVTGIKVTTTQSKSEGSIISVLIKFLVGLILLFVILKAMSCTAPKPKETCHYAVTSYPCTDTLVFIPTLINDEPSIGDALVLYPKSYVNVAMSIGNDTYMGYVLKEDVKYLCVEHVDYLFSFMDADKVSPYHRAKPLMDRYKKWVHLNHQRDKQSHQEFETLKREYKKDLEKIVKYTKE